MEGIFFEKSEVVVAVVAVAVSGIHFYRLGMSSSSYIYMTSLL